MIVIEFLDAVDTLAKALAVWVVIGAAIATPVVLVAGWAVTRVVKWAWRGARRARGASDGPDEDRDGREAHEAAESHTGTPGYREAA